MPQNKIRAVRKATKITQDELAKQLGINRATISKYENGEISLSLKMLRKIAAALHVDWTELVPEEEQAGIIIEHTIKSAKEVAENGGFDKVPNPLMKPKIQRIYSSLNTDGRLEAGEYLLSFLLERLSYEGAEHDLEEVMTRLNSVASIPQYQQYNVEAQEDQKNG